MFISWGQLFRRAKIRLRKALKRPLPQFLLSPIWSEYHGVRLGDKGVRISRELGSTIERTVLIIDRPKRVLGRADVIGYLGTPG